MRKPTIAVMGWTLWDGKGRTPSGGAATTYELTKRLSKHFDCDMIFETSDRTKAERTETTEDGFRKRFILRPKGSWRLSQDFLDDYDLIHIWDAAPVFTYRAFTSKFLPHCYTLHSAASMTDWIGLASAFHASEYDMIALGSRCLAEALSKFWPAPADVIPYGVDTDTFKLMNKEECRESLGLPKDEVLLGYLGRLSKLDLVLAYDTLRTVKRLARREGVTLAVAGGNKDITPLHVKDDLIYLGYLEKAEVPQFLNSCDVFFNPAAGAREGFGLTTIEAMACGLPIVTTSWDGYRDTVSPDVGFLARTCWKDGDVWIRQADMVSACKELISNNDLKETMGKSARSRVERNYRWDLCVEKYRTGFLNLIRKGQPQHPQYEGAASRVCSLEEKLKHPESLRIGFRALHEGFVSDPRQKGKEWRRFMCVDNVVNLPKYRPKMKKTLKSLELRLSTHFPKLVKALE